MSNIEKKTDLLDELCELTNRLVVNVATMTKEGDVRSVDLYKDILNDLYKPVTRLQQKIFLEQQRER